MNGPFLAQGTRNFVTVTNDDHWSKVSNVKITAAVEAAGLVCRSVSPIQLFLPVSGAVHSDTTRRQKVQSSAFWKVYKIIKLT